MLRLLAGRVSGDDGAATASSGGKVRRPRRGAEAANFFSGETDVATRKERRNGYLPRGGEIGRGFRGRARMLGRRKRRQRRQEIRVAVPDADGYHSLIGPAA